ncbi:hypothetical protein FRZ61_23440 [Hypericibacter adhaerens]|uniref:Uncharacterized protein n=1 Tax=Hypericibacter adhaerens TaxID=2602016 RepID=A0A5J6MZF8_9PROT|nr:hypothetical protein FRZ61_23440 [Hypericibacter adhaerens]
MLDVRFVSGGRLHRDRHILSPGGQSRHREREAERKATNEIHDPLVMIGARRSREAPKPPQATMKL